MRLLSSTCFHFRIQRAVITLLLQDDGGTENGGVDTSASQQLTITIGAVNDASSFPGGADLTVLEDAGAQSVNG